MAFFEATLGNDFNMLLRGHGEIVDASIKSDEDILALSVDHPGLFEVLIDRYQEPFLRKAMKVLGTREDAEDAVQESFVKIYRYAGTFQVQEGASFKSWGYKILMNTSFTHYQKMKKRGDAFADIPPEMYEDLVDRNEEGLETKAARDEVASVFSRMPVHLAEVLKLHLVEGRPHKEIALKEGSSVSAIKTRVHRAKKEFRKVYETFNKGA